MRSLKTIAGNLLCIPLAVFERWGKPISKLIYVMNLALLVESVLLLIFSVMNPNVGLCTNNLWMSIACGALSYLCFCFRSFCDLEDTDVTLTTIFFLMFPTIGLSIAAVVINIVRMVFKLGDAMPVRSKMPVIILTIFGLYVLMLAVAVIMAFWEIRLIRHCEIVISDGPFEKVRWALVKSGKMKNLELSPSSFLPKNHIEVWTFLPAEESVKNVREGEYHVRIDHERIEVRRVETLLCALDYESLHIYVNPKGKRLRESA